MDNEVLMARLLAGAASAKEQEQFEQWLAEDTTHQQQWADAQQLWQLADTEPLPQGDATAAWSDFEAWLDEAEETTEAPAPKVRSLVKRSYWWAAAASILLVLGLGYALGLQEKRSQPIAWETVATLDGEKKTVMLPDGSTVQLNEESTLRYVADFSPRQVELTGEGFFEVVRDESSPFQVLAGGATTTVLGTSFNVSAYADQPTVEVVVATGKVAVEIPEEKSVEKVTLERGTSAVFDRSANELIRQDSADPNAMAWRTKRLEFRDIQMREVIPILEAYYDITIKVSNPDILGCRLHNPYMNDPKLEEVLAVIKFMLDLSVSEAGNTYTFDGEGCEQNH